MRDEWYGNCVNSGEGGLVMTIGGILLLAITVAVVVICVKVRKNSQKLQDLESILSKE